MQTLFMLDNRHNGDSIRKLHSAQAHIQLDEHINSALNYRRKLSVFNKLTFKTSIPNKFLLNLRARLLKIARYANATQLSSQFLT